MFIVVVLVFSSLTIRVPGFGAVVMDLNFICQCECEKPSMAVSSLHKMTPAYKIIVGCFESCFQKVKGPSKRKSKRFVFFVIGNVL